METLLSITPLDGRYKNKINELSEYLSEYALFKYRLFIEIEYFIELIKLDLPQLKNIDSNYLYDLKNIFDNFTPSECVKIKNIENTINHDVKSVEYYLQEKFKEINMQKYIPFIHFGLTSQDINTSAVMLSLRDNINKCIIPTIDITLNILDKMYNDWKNIPMLARTHGQVASPTTMGKELNVFKYRLKTQLNILNNAEYRSKFSGAVGNFNAHYAAYPNIDWEKFADNFMKTLGLIRNNVTTQISNYDEISYILDCIKRINTIFIDLNCDIWNYISHGYFKQKVKSDEVGSSTMPHKVNPIDFENSEGNLIISISLIECLSRKLPISRMQRDLTDSTILRNIGTIFGHSLLGYKSTINGLDKLLIAKEKLKEDLENNYIVIAEGIQTILRREGITDSYEQLKELTRVDNNITKKTFENFINGLNISEKIKEELNSITVYNYIGNSAN